MQQEKPILPAMGSTTIEVWKAIKGYEGLYEVSNMGRVKSLARVKRWYRGEKLCEVHAKERILKQVPYGNKFKYLVVGLSKQKEIDEPSKRRAYYVHRLVAETFIPNPQNKGDVNHIDGNTHNNSVNNLEWATRKENIAHAYRTGLNTNFGSGHIAAKLTEDQVKEIREGYESGKRGCGTYSLAKKYSVSRWTIRRILEGKVWKRA